MDYKKIIKNQEVRFKILRMLDILPDKVMIPIQYKIKIGRKLNLKNPRRYSEKIQWYKINYRNPLMTQCVDKYGVRDYVKSKGLEKILIPILGIYDNVNEIEYEKLPNKFIIKTTNGSHTNIFCRDKKNFNIIQANSMMEKWMNSKREKLGREWAYYNVKPRILIEEILGEGEKKDFREYKFFCFNGEVYMYYLCVNRNEKAEAEVSLFKKDTTKLPYSIKGNREVVDKYDIPNNMNEMFKYAEILSKDFPHVRVDLYNVNGKIYFGELTFYNASGYIEFEPDEFDFILGEEFQLPLT